MKEKQVQDNPKVRKTIGYLDGILSAVLIFQILCYTLPALVGKSEMEKIHQQNRLANAAGPGESIDALLLPAWPSVNSHSADPNEYYEKWKWGFIGICSVFATVPVCASTLLVSSASKKIEDSEVYDLTKSWMHCNIFTILLAAVEFFVVLEMYLWGIPVGVPIPTLLYLIVRGIFTAVIGKQLLYMSEQDYPRPFPEEISPMELAKNESSMIAYLLNL